MEGTSTSARQEPASAVILRRLILGLSSEIRSVGVR
jgi:hypothetical protein